MTNRFRVQRQGPGVERARLFLDEPVEGSRSMVASQFARKLPSPAESEDWVFVENSEDQSGAGAVRTGWLKSWAIGEPIPDLPQTISAQSLTEVGWMLEEPNIITTPQPPFAFSS